MAGDHGVPCPGCGGHDRFAVNLRKNVWVCRVSGEGGDAIALARHIDGTDFLEAVETIIGYPSPNRASRLTETQRRAIVAHAEMTAQETEAKRCEAEESSQHFRERERRKAWQTWSEGAPIAGTPAEDYLALRGLHTSGGARLRFHPSLPFWDKPNFHGGAIVHQGPALVAAIEGPDGHFAGVHRTWIDLSKPKGKAIITDPETGEILRRRKCAVRSRAARFFWFRAASTPISRRPARRANALPRRRPRNGSSRFKLPRIEAFAISALARRRIPLRCEPRQYFRQGDRARAASNANAHR